MIRNLIYIYKIKVVASNVDSNNNKTQRKFTRLTDIVDNILNVLLK